MVRMSLPARRRALVDAALTVIAREGLAAASVRAIVTEAGMPLGAFHYAFDSGEELLSSAIEQVTENERSAVFASLADLPHGAPLQETLRAGIAGYVQTIRSDQGHERALLELALHQVRSESMGSDGVNGASAQWSVYRAAAATALEVVAERCNVEWVYPVPDMARRLVLLTDGLTLSWLIDADAEAIDADAQALADLFCTLARERAAEE